MEGAVFKEIKFEQKLEEKVITGGQNLLNFLGKAKKVVINGGYHIIKINSHVETLEITGSFKDLLIKAPVDNLTIYGGKSNIYVHDYMDSHVKKFYIIGGSHLIDIHSKVEDIEIHGGVNEIKCNYENSKINKLIAKGGKQEIYLNKKTDKCEKDCLPGAINFHLTEIIKEDLSYHVELEEQDIVPVNYIKPKDEKDDTVIKHCVICLSDFTESDKIYILPCTHRFHISCLKEFFETKEKEGLRHVCPTCNIKINGRLID